MSIFSKIQKTHVKSNTFDLTHDRKMSSKMGKLTPIMVMDCVPGDKISIKSNVFLRFAPMIAPVMHRVSVYCHFFFVPNRILWPNWEKFITGGEDGYDTSVHPYVTPLAEGAGQSTSTLSDYLGLPTGIQSNERVSAFPYAAYNKIYNDYYRDQNQQDPIIDELNDGANPTLEAQSFVRNRAWQHDYFTSALPWTQKGPEALLPLSGDAEIEFRADSERFQKFVNLDGTEFPSDGQINYDLPSAENVLKSGPNPGDPLGAIDLNNTHYTDLSSVTAASINDLRKAFKLQEWLEKNARGGSRYIESIAVHFGVRSSDQRLQRPKFLGGMSAPVKISEVLQTAPPTTAEDGTTPQGNMAGHAISVGSGGYVSHFCEEHGYIIGIMSVMPITSYQQGIPRHFSRMDKFDYYWPEFAHIGEQEILNKELYLRPGVTVPENDEVFGYIPRYSEYKYLSNTVHGDLRTNLDFWHMGRKFATPPALNQDFIEMDDEEVNRIFAVEDGTDTLWSHVLNEVKAKRKMPVFGTPHM